MLIVVSYDGRRAALARLVPYFSTLTLRLFVNDFYPYPSDDAAAFVEATFNGYTPRPLPTWSAVYLNARFEAETTAPQQTWTVGPMGGANIVYGYYLTDTSGRVILSERDPRPGQPMDTVGSVYSIMPRIDLSQLFESNVFEFRNGVRVGGHFPP